MPKKSKQRSPKLRRQSDKELELYRLLCEGAGDGIFTADLQGRITYLNKAGESLLKVTAKRATGQLFRKFIHRDSIAKAVKCLQKAKKGVGNIKEEINVVAKRGRVIPLEVNISPLFKDDKIIGLHGIVRDIAGRKQFEHYLMEAEKMRALSHFIYGTTQEIQAPLDSIFVATKRLTEKYKHRDFEYIGFKEFKDIFQTIQSINNQVRYCSDTLNRLVSLNKRKVGVKGKKTDVNATIRQAAALISDQMKIANVKLRLRLTGKLPSVALGSIELNQIISNITTNALQALTSGGHLIIKTSYMARDRKIRVTFEDDGIGISRENLRRVFDPFFTTKHRGVDQNSGLGLAIVYAIIKGAKGDISIESSLRKGTKVKVELPVMK